MKPNHILNGPSVHHTNEFPDIYNAQFFYRVIGPECNSQIPYDQNLVFPASLVRNFKFTKCKWLLSQLSNAPQNQFPPGGGP